MAIICALRRIMLRSMHKSVWKCNVPELSYAPVFNLWSCGTYIERGESRPWITHSFRTINCGIFERMSLHRIGRVADWDAVSLAARNRWQQLAAKTHGFVTPGNFISILSAALAFLGMVWIYQGHELAGLTTLAIGRLGDVLDGYVADITGTKSSLGETLDAGLDKATVFGALVLLLALSIVPNWLVILLGIQQLLAALVGAYAKSAGLGLHPSPFGKATMTAQWIMLMLCIIGYAVSFGSPMTAIVYSALGVTVLAGYIVVGGYIRHVLRTRSTERH